MVFTSAPWTADSVKLRIKAPQNTGLASKEKGGEVCLIGLLDFRFWAQGFLNSSPQLRPLKGYSSKKKSQTIFFNLPAISITAETNQSPITSQHAYKWRQQEDRRGKGEERTQSGLRSLWNSGRIQPSSLQYRLRCQPKAHTKPSAVHLKWYLHYS